MAASVRTEDEAFADMRYERLAELAGLADADHARGKMLRLWRQCTLEHRYSLPIDDVSRVLGAHGVHALIESRLGEMDGADVRIRGTKGRIEWLKKLRVNGRKGGRPRKPKGYPSGSGESNPPAPAPASAPATTPAREKITRGPRPAPPAEALALADLLRDHIVEGQPSHLLTGREAWAAKRERWAREFDLLLRRDKRTAIASRSLIAWVFGPQGGTEARFVVESPGALRAKWDAIARAMSRKPSVATGERFHVVRDRDDYPDPVTEQSEF